MTEAVFEELLRGNGRNKAYKLVAERGECAGDDDTVRKIFTRSSRYVTELELRLTLRVRQTVDAGEEPAQAFKVAAESLDVDADEVEKIVTRAWRDDPGIAPPGWGQE